ncbi:MAG: hypothetical protein BJ554DRAFT_3132, partial [Olpidium bornovanus]
ALDDAELQTDLDLLYHLPAGQDNGGVGNVTILGPLLGLFPFRAVRASLLVPIPALGTATVTVDGCPSCMRRMGKPHDVAAVQQGLAPYCHPEGTGRRPIPGFSPPDAVTLFRASQQLMSIALWQGIPYEAVGRSAYGYRRSALNNLSPSNDPSSPAARQWGTCIAATQSRSRGAARRYNTRRSSGWQAGPSSAGSSSVTTFRLHDGRQGDARDDG